MNNNKYAKIEPFFDAIINAFKKMLFAIIKGVLSPVIDILRKLAKIVVDFIGNTILKPIFRPIGAALNILVWPLKPLFAFIGYILKFIVSIIKFLASIVDMLLSLPFRILSGM
jgi:phage-related protein